jgi:Mg2+ and Co2+ transporter CorA
MTIQAKTIGDKKRRNEILAMQTILFTLSIPVTVAAAFYGMNVGIETGSPIFLGQYTSLILLVIAAIVPVVIMMWYFKRQGWIEFQ